MSIFVQSVKQTAMLMVSAERDSPSLLILYPSVVKFCLVCNIFLVM